ncbi:MAG: hypothetical protein WEA76_07040 [Acidimicrobiia bacterium]
MRNFLVALVLALAACGGGEVIAVPEEPSTSLPMCDELPVIFASDELYGDRPVYVGNEMPVEEVQAWASSQPGFETLWIDRDHNGWLTLAFSEGAADRQADVERLFPDDGVVVVEVDWTMAALEQLQISLPGRFDPGFVQTSGISVTQGVVSVGIGPLTPERIATAEAELAGEPVCLEGIDPALVPEPGPQPQAGDGWRLLADEKTGHAYRTGFASDRADFEELWREAGISGPLPEVDFESEVVIWFGAVYGSSCPNLRMDEVVISGDLVYPVIVDVDAPMACTGDANPHAYVVAVERSALPADGFVIQLQAGEPSSGVLDQQTFVRGDVTVPGSYVAGVRGELPGEEPGPPHVEYGGVIEPGYPWAYNLYVHCGIEWLGEINSIQWRAESVPGQLGYIPDEWREAVDEKQYVTVELLLTPGDPPVLEATALGHTVRYLPASADPPGCD